MMTRAEDRETERRKERMRYQMWSGLAAGGFMVVAALAKRYWGIDLWNP